MTTFCTLRGGLTIPTAVIECVLDLEERGIVLTAHGQNIHANQPGSLTERDRQNVRRWRLHILALLAYQAPEVQQ